MIKNKKGFSLIEVMLAVAIIAGMAIVLNMAWTGNFLRYRKSRTNTTAAFLLQQKITDYELKYKDEKLNRIPDEESGDFGKDYPKYSWEFKSQDFEMPDLKPLIISGETTADETTLTILGQMQEYFNKSIKEAKVTVLYKVKKKKKKFSVSFFFVDYEQDVSALSSLGSPGGDNE